MTFPDKNEIFCMRARTHAYIYTYARASDEN